MLDFLKLLTKRPSDKAIKILRISAWLIYILIIYYNLIYLNKEIDTNYFWYEVTPDKVIYIKYFIASLWIAPIAMWAFDLCILKSKYVRIIQILIWLLLFYISSIIKETASLDVDTLILMMWFFPIIAWITWKCITKKCLRYKEKVTKIRV